MLWVGSKSVVFRFPLYAISYVTQYVLLCAWFKVFPPAFQVDEAVAVLQAHQAKEAAQKSVTNSGGVPSV